VADYTTAKLPRQTFEDVLKAQRTLGTIIQDIISGNGKTMSQEEQWDFNDLWQRATLGIGAREPLLHQNVPGSNKISINYYVFNLLISGNPTIRVGYDDGKQQDMPAAELWRYVLMRLRGVIFGSALEHAALMSPEKPGGEIHV